MRIFCCVFRDGFKYTVWIVLHCFGGLLHRERFDSYAAWRTALRFANNSLYAPVLIWRGVTNPIPECLCLVLYQLTKSAIQLRACLMSMKYPGYCTEYFIVLKYDSINGLSLLTLGRDRLTEMFMEYRKASRLIPFIGWPLSEWRWMPFMLCSDCNRLNKSRAKDSSSRSWISHPTITLSQISIILYAYRYIPLTSVASQVISQHHTWFGPVAITSGGFVLFFLGLVFPRWWSLLWTFNIL